MKTGWRENLELNFSLASSLPAFMDVLLSAAREVWTQTESLSDADLQEFKRLVVVNLERVLRRSGKTEYPTESIIAQLEQSRSQFHRLVELGDLLIVRTNPQFQILEVRGNTDRILGVPPEELVSNPSVWRRFLDDHDLRLLRIKLRSASLTEELSAEIKVINRKYKQTRWLLVKGVPLLSPEGQLMAWEGIGLDITEKHEFHRDLLSERKRLRALYEMSSTLQAISDPAIASLKGIQALRSATTSDAAFACFYDASQDTIELAAAEGFAEKSLRAISPAVNGKSLTRAAVQEARAFIIDNLETDRRSAAPEVLQSEGVKSAVFAPLIQEKTVIGVVALFSKRRGHYRTADLDLLNAALQQLSLCIHKAEFFASERRQANVVSALYQLSHELSRLMTPREMAAHAFPIIQGELACKRMWLGVMDDQSSHIVGQAGTGPGVRRTITDLQIDLAERHDYLDKAIKSKEPVIVPAGTEMECSALNRVRSRLEIGLFIIVPLVSLGQVVGVLLLEPVVSSPAVVQRKLPLLKNMAGEIATIMLARRFEAKMAEADKMRMAGVLASGVAHNFNNLLQAVMGQASLIEMQLPPNSQLLASTRMILESAGKGAALIKQLMSFSMQGGAVRRTLSANTMIGESSELYRSVLGSRTELVLKLAESVPSVYADHSQLQQVITNLLMNAREAIGELKEGRVTITTSEVRVRPGELDPELAPGIYLRIDVEDNGAGMDAARLARCFEPFYTTKNLDTRTGVGLTGAGLGLSSSYSLVKQHDGIISVRSSPGEGSVFTVYIPALTVRSEDTDREREQPLDKKRQGAVMLSGLDNKEQEQAAEFLNKVALTPKAARSVEQLSSQFTDDVHAIVHQCGGSEQREPMLEELARIIQRKKYRGPILLVDNAQALPAALRAHESSVVTVERPYFGAAFEKMIREVLRRKADATAASTGAPSDNPPTRERIV